MLSTALMRYAFAPNGASSSDPDFDEIKRRLEKPVILMVVISHLSE